jgi:Ser/Thr protein kinase RdoA (MazF antagonist)
MNFNSIFSSWKFGEVQDVRLLSNRAYKVATHQGDYLLKIKHDIEQITRERSLLAHLRDKDVHSHQVLDQYTTESGEVYCLYSWLAGETPKQPISFGRQFGHAIGRLHIALQSIDIEYGFPTRNLYNTTYGWVLKSMEDSDDDRIHGVVKLIQELQAEMAILQDLPQHLIHRDAHGGNMVFEDAAFMGFIDFDIPERNIRLFDPCYCAMGVLPIEFANAGFSKNWLSFLGSIISGYGQINPLTVEEIRSIWYVLICIEAMFVALFIKSNPAISSQNAAICMWLAEMREEIEHHVLFA